MKTTHWLMAGLLALPWATSGKAALVSSWGFEQTLTDAAGGNNNGTWQVGTGTYGTGRIGNYAADFNGTNYISTPATDLPTGDGAWTISFWLRSDPISQDSMAIFAYGSPSSSQARTAQYNWSAISNQWMILEAVWNDDPRYPDTVGTLDGTWHQVALAYNPSNNVTTFYVDGERLGTDTGTRPNTASSGTAYIGANLDLSHGIRFNGQLDDVGIWNVGTLGDAMIRSLVTTPALLGLSDYGTYKMDKLFQVYDQSLPEWTDGLLTWQRITGLAGHALGDAWFADGAYYVQLGDGTGVFAIPEANGAVFAGLAVIAFVMRRRLRKTP